MRKIFLLIIVLTFSLPVFAQQPKKVTVTEQEQQNLLQAYGLRQQSQQKLEERKKFYEALLQLCKNDLNAAQSEDDKAVMVIRNVELQIGNAHNFNPENYDKTDAEGKLVYVEKPKKEKEAEKPKEGK